MDSTCTADAPLSRASDGVQSKLYQDAASDFRTGPVRHDQAASNQLLPKLQINCDSSSAPETLSGSPFVLPEVDLVGLTSMRENAQDEQARFRHELRRQRQDNLRETNEEIIGKFDEATAVKVESALSSFKNSLEDAAIKGYSHAVVYNIPERPILMTERGPNYTPPRYAPSQVVNTSPRQNDSRQRPSVVVVEIGSEINRLNASEKQLVQTLADNGWAPKLIWWSSGQKGICVELP